MNAIFVEQVKAVNKKLTVDFSCSGQVKKLVGQTQFFAEYNVRVENVPEAVLVIPFLSTICPIAWACQADVYVNTVDEVFLQSLERIRIALQKFYPRMRFEGKIHVAKVFKPENANRTKSMMLLTLGVDSLATYVRHESETPVLVSVHGADIDVNDLKGWDAHAKNLIAFSKATGCEFRPVKSNFRALPDEIMLKMIYRNAIIGKGTWRKWYSHIMHGLALTGLSAPIAYLENVGTLYIASSDTEETRGPYGSAPEIDNNVSWTGTKTIHDGYELNRVGKTALVADYVRRRHLNLHIQVCSDTKGKNCSRCEKCGRTIMALELAGIDPNNHGFEIKPGTFSNIKKYLMNGYWLWTKRDKDCWIGIQCRGQENNVVLPHPQAKEVLSWLSHARFENFEPPVLKKSEQLVYSISPLLKYLPYPLIRVAKTVLFKLNFIPRY